MGDDLLFLGFIYKGLIDLHVGGDEIFLGFLYKGIDAFTNKSGGESSLNGGGTRCAQVMCSWLWERGCTNEGK